MHHVGHHPPPPPPPPPPPAKRGVRVSPAAESVAIPVAEARKRSATPSASTPGTRAPPAMAASPATPRGRRGSSRGTNAGHASATTRAPAASANQKRRSAPAWRRARRGRSFAPTCRPTRAIVPTSKAMKTLQARTSLRAAQPPASPPGDDLRSDVAEHHPDRRRKTIVRRSELADRGEGDPAAPHGTKTGTRRRLRRIVSARARQTTRS